VSHFDASRHSDCLEYGVDQLLEYSAAGEGRALVHQPESAADVQRIRNDPLRLCHVSRPVGPHVRALLDLHRRWADRYLQAAHALVQLEHLWTAPAVYR
jgi:hypothetical protein